MKKSRVPLRLHSPGRNERPEHWCYTCCLPGCRGIVALSGDHGSPLCVCLAHAKQLTDRLFREVDDAANGCVFSIDDIERALTVRLRVKRFFAKGPKR